jgi:large subunit ribosomal protein L17
MRHSRVINHLGRTSSHRRSMLANMATSLILNKRITTTTAKAKALRTFVEPLITKSRDDSTHSRRVVFSYLKDKTAVSELFREVSPKIGERPGGYTRILKIGNRLGDNADMCIIELVDYNEAMLGGEVTKTKAARRRRSTRKKAETDKNTEAPMALKTKTGKAEKLERRIRLMRLKNQRRQMSIIMENQSRENSEICGRQDYVGIGQ